MSEELNTEEVIEEASQEEITGEQETITEEANPEIKEEPKVDPGFVETENENVQKRFNKMTAQRKAAESKAQELQEKLDKIEAQNLEATLSKPAPTEEDVDFDPELYRSKLAEHYEQVAEAKANQKALLLAKQARIAEQQAETDQAYNEKAQDYVSKNPSFEQSVGNLQGMNQELINHIKTLENGPEVFHALSNDMSVAAQINNAALQGNGIAVGTILSQVQNEIKSGPKDKVVTDAPSTIESPLQAGITATDPNKKYIHSQGATFE